jgi:hypothetical protein
VSDPVKEIVPDNAPWKLNWKEVAKASGTEVTDSPPQSEGIVDRVTKAVKPWLMDWGLIKKEADKVEVVKTPPPVKQAPEKFDLKTYISKLGETESSGNPTAKAKTSSATGLHQFTSSTWMEMVNKLDLPYTLKDRTNPDKSTKVAEEFTKRNLERAKNDLGRVPTMVEAYMYHFIGRSAPKLIQAPPDEPATKFITASQAKANKSVFYNKDGTPKTVKEVLTKYEGRFK